MKYLKLVLFGQCSVKNMTLSQFAKLITKANKSIFIKDRFNAVYCGDKDSIVLRPKYKNKN